MVKILSIIVPTFNMEKYLNKCLGSLVGAKKLEQLEVIVVNDGSIDSSSAIAHEYECRFPGVFIVIDKSNGNYGSCINAALKVVSGKYVKILDSDDSFYPESFSNLLDILSVTDVDLVLNDYVKEYTSGKRIEYQYDIPAKKVLRFDDIYDTKAMYDILLPAITYRTEILRTINYKQTEGISYTDTEWCFSPMTQVKTVYYFNQIIYRYLMGREGQTMDPQVFKKSISDRLKCFSAMLRSICEMELSMSIKEFTSKQLIKHAQYIYNYYLIDNVEAERSSIEKFDEEFKALNRYAYDKCASIPYRLHMSYCHIKDWRERKIKKIPLKVRFVQKVLDICGTIRIKLFVRNNPNEER